MKEEELAQIRKYFDEKKSKNILYKIAVQVVMILLFRFFRFITRL